MTGHPMISTPLGQYINVKDFGAIGDAHSHPLSQRYGSLSQAQIDYPHATSLDQEIDWAAIQAAIRAVGTAQDPRGAPVLIPRGSYLCSDDLHICRQIVLMGAGRATTELRFAEGKGIIVHNPRTSPDGGDGTYSTITNLDVQGQKLGKRQMGVSDPGKPIDQWQATTEYLYGDRVRAPHDNRFYYECIKPGVSRSAAAAWLPGKTYQLNDVITPDKPILFRCVGTSGSQESGDTEPIWDLNLDATAKDDQVTWQRYVPTTPLAPPLAWSANHVYNVDDVVQPTSHFLDNLLFVCVRPETSGTTEEPLWIAQSLDQPSDFIADLGVQWKRYPVFPEVPDTSTLWKPNTRYKFGDLVRSEVFDPANPSSPKTLVIFECTTPGVSGPGPNEPVWIRTPNTLGEDKGETAGTFTVDNTVHWTCREAFYYWVADGEVVWACRLAAGIWLRTQAYLHNVQVKGFTCAAVHIQSQAYPYCNVNAWHVDHLFCGTCGVGIAVQRTDANAGVGVAVQVIAAGFGIPGNGGFGIYDRGASNTWITCLAEVCTGRAYFTTNIAAQGVLLGCYSEAAQPSYVSQSSIVIGGADGAGISPLSQGWFVRHGQDVKPFRVNNARGSGVGTHLGIDDDLNTVLGWRAEDETHVWRLRWYKSERVWSTEWATSSFFRATYLTGGPNDGVNGHPRGPGLQGFPSLLLGAASNPNIKISTADASPTSGTWQKGDRILNNDPIPGHPVKGYAGWICTESSSDAPPVGMWKRFGLIEP